MQGHTVPHDVKTQKDSQFQDAVQNKRMFPKVENMKVQRHGEIFKHPVVKIK